MAKHVVAKVSEIPAGGRKIVEVAGRSVGVFNIEGTFYALRNRCPHNGGPLCEGGPVVSLLEADRPGAYTVDYSRKLVTCPWHGWEYDIVTGQSWFDPVHSRVRAYPVSVVSGAEVQQGVPDASGRIQGPYVADVYPVAIDDDLVVIEVRD